MLNLSQKGGNFLMSIKKLENSSDHAMVAEEVKILTNLLNESTRQLSGDVVFNKIQDLIKISAQKDYDALEKQIASLTNQEMMVVARYFATLPLLVNISEDVELASEVNLLNNTDQDYLGKLEDTIDLVAQKENANEILKHVNVVPVLTAHPTQVQRKTVLELTDQIHNLLRNYREVKNGTINQAEWTEKLRAYIEILMQTDIIRSHKLENLHVCLDRVMPFWEDHIAPDLLDGKNVIIAAHGNSLRALTKYIENISDDDIMNLEMKTGEPVVYTFDDKLDVVNKEKLDD